MKRRPGRGDLLIGAVVVLLLAYVAFVGDFDGFAGDGSTTAPSSTPAVGGVGLPGGTVPGGMDRRPR